jgi:hypothetical protein
MDLLCNNWAGRWTCAAASIVLVAVAFVVTAPRDLAAVAEPAGAIAPIEEAAAGITFKIMPADVMSRNLSWAPRTGDGSN